MTIAVVVCLWLAFDNQRFRRAGIGQNPASDLFLRQILTSGRPVQIVVSDGITLALNAYLEHMVTPLEYRSPGFPKQLLEQYVAPNRKPVRY